MGAYSEYSSWQETTAEENICSCVSIDPISNTGPVLYCVTHSARNLPWAPRRPYCLLRCLLGIIWCVLWLIPQLMQWGRAFPEATFWDLSATLWWPFNQPLPSPRSAPSLLAPQYNRTHSSKRGWLAFVKIMFDFWAVLAPSSIYLQCKSC